MASHNRTPRSVRHAPKREVIFIHETKGMNRQQRRHGASGPFIDEAGNKHAGWYGARFPDLYRRRFQGWSFAEMYPSSNTPL